MVATLLTDEARALLTVEDALALVEAVQALSAAKDVADVMAVIHRHARDLIGADGVTFVLRDGDLCFYAEEDAIGPLWKGRRFPMSTCISGWCMSHREPVAIPDIYADPRIPADAYRPTFVHSLAMAPVRREDPLAAIGAYWATRREPTPREVALLGALADATAVALTHADLLARAQWAEGRFRALAEAMPQVVWSTFPDGQLDYANSRWREATGATVAPGTPWHVAVHPDDVATVSAEWQAALARAQPFACTCRVVTRDGAPRWVLCRAEPVRDERGQLARWVGTCTDIHDHKLAEQEMARAVAVRDQFLALASHELKTPLTALTLQLEALQRADDADPRRPERLRQAIAQAGRLTELVGSLLDVTAITAGRLTLARRAAELGAIVASVVERQRATAERRGSELRVRERGAAIGEWDPERVGRVVAAVIGNAIKFGEGRPIDVEVTTDGPDALLIVRDRGIGIAASEHATLFEQFRRAVSEQHYGGLGLGLWLAREIVQAHGGSITVHSERGDGAEFRIRLPRLLS